MQSNARSMFFPEMFRFRAERGVATAVMQAARQRRQSSSEYLRKAIRNQLVADGVQLPPVEETPPLKARA